MPASTGDLAVDAAVRDLRSELWRASPFRFVSRPVIARFTAVATKTEVLHQCAEVPDGFLPLRTNGAVISDDPGTQWTKDLAYLRSTVATDVLGCFYKLREDPLEVFNT
jgi:hypothetical protein